MPGDPIQTRFFALCVVRKRHRFLLVEQAYLSYVDGEWRVAPLSTLGTEGEI